jgi:hypothetical protein
MILKPINNKEIQGNTEAFFKSKRWKNTLVFLGFIVLASCFWAIQYIRQRFDFEVPMKIQYIHVPKEIVFSNSLPQELMLHVQDKGSAYLNYLVKQRKQSLSVTVDLQAISPSQTSYVVDQTVLYKLLDGKLFATTQVNSFTPDRIEINYALLAQKELPVTINGTISPAAGYLFMDSIRIEPAQVVVYGNKNVLDTLREIQTQPLDYKDINKNLDVSADLLVPEGVHLSYTEVRLKATVEEYTEKTFELPVICYNMPPNRDVRFFPSTVELGVKIGLSKFAKLSRSNFEIAVNYNDLTGKNTANCSLTLTRKPLDVKSYRIAPDVVEFLIEQKK